MRALAALELFSALLQVRRTLAPLNGPPETDHNDGGGKAWLLSLSDTGAN